MAKAKNKVESVKLEFGSVRQKTPGGTYYFRYQINGIRKEIPLHTTSKEDAIRQAKELIPVTKAKSIDMVAAHVKQAKGLEKIERKLPLDEAWHIYSTHPDRATPHTVSEQLAYKTTFEEFLSFISTLPYVYCPRRFAHAGKNHLRKKNPAGISPCGCVIFRHFIYFAQRGFHGGSVPAFSKQFSHRTR